MATGGRELTTQLPVKLVFGGPIFDYPVCVTAVGSATVSTRGTTPTKTDERLPAVRTPRDF
ncbi:hypothetical protein A9K66_23825 [Mesorhizobium sp. AA23]|nr:hypothetical protein A9K66_23825 [Mesorhizobium sp. AA23]